ncbi:MAG: hypothetical protein AAGM38_09345 [Pseudomonadota bacterium]
MTDAPRHDFELHGPPHRVRVDAFTPEAKRFLAEFGAVGDANAANFIHAAKRAGLSVRHTQGSVPEGWSLSEWHDHWDGIGRLSQGD